MPITPSTSDYIIIFLPPHSAEWSGMLAQFTLAVAASEGRAYASWAGERFSRATERSHGVAALADGHLLGVMFFERVGRTVEISFPWTAVADQEVARDLVGAAMQCSREQWPEATDLRVERQLLPDPPAVSAVIEAGFACYWRKRMRAELDDWTAPLLVPAGYRLGPWNIRELDAAAGVVYAANRGMLDAHLYAAFFGTAPCDCRHGLLSILAGKYGSLHQQATLCAFQGTELVGINLVIDGDDGIASIIEIAVSPAHQRRGLGRMLMIGSMRILKEERVASVELAVTAANTSALHLYQTLGFFEVEEFAVCVLETTTRSHYA